MVTWGDPFHVVWNTATGLVWILAIVAIVLIPTDRFARRWRTKAWWVLATVITIDVGGLYIPLGALVWPVAVRRYRRHLAPE